MNKISCKLRDFVYLSLKIETIAVTSVILIYIKFTIL